MCYLHFRLIASEENDLVEIMMQAKALFNYLIDISLCRRSAWDSIDYPGDSEGFRMSFLL